MHARQLVEIAALLAVAPRQRDAATLCEEALAECWIASRCRVDHWSRALRRLGHSQTAPADAPADLLERLSEEITLSGVLTRVVAALTHGLEQRAHQGVHGTASVAANSLASHQEASSRLQGLVAAWWPRDGQRAKRFVRVRKLAARWSDHLVAYAAPIESARRFAIDSAVVEEVAADIPTGAAARGAAQRLLRLGVRTATIGCRCEPLRPELNARIAGAALGLIGPGAFDGHGLLRSPWMSRVERVADDAAAMVEQLFLDAPPRRGDLAAGRWRV